MSKTSSVLGSSPRLPRRPPPSCPERIAVTALSPDVDLRHRLPRPLPPSRPEHVAVAAPSTNLAKNPHFSYRTFAIDYRGRYRHPAPNTLPSPHPVPTWCEILIFSYKTFAIDYRGRYRHPAPNTSPLPRLAPTWPKSTFLVQDLPHRLPRPPPPSRPGRVAVAAPSANLA
ncbi:hypothetical protein MSAN_02078300 [Mycena sanguinolenta]|uniref:Uncharacterized protein n=1 Tax=Mycena sanguinolenta TaxID=230812 RepID=A0A8H7CMP9_9AGAR|nr:hypothetical protein MSAN_02078300 [Mycena sanguinolenta]